MPALPGGNRGGRHSHCRDTWLWGRLSPPPPPHAQVYKATWRQTPVAVKVLFSLQGEQEAAGEAALTLSNPVLFDLHKECGLMISLRHPNVVSIMGVSANPPAMITGGRRHAR